MRIHATLKGASNMISIVRNRNALQYFVHSLLICAALIYGPRQAFAQTTDSSGEQTREPQLVSDSSPSSNQPSEDQHQPPTQPGSCGVAHLCHSLKYIDHDPPAI